MWFRRGKDKTEQVEKIQAATFARIDKVTTSIDRNTKQLDRLNKALEERNDIAYNVFVATGGLRRQKEQK